MIKWIKENKIMLITMLIFETVQYRYLFQQKTYFIC